MARSRATIYGRERLGRFGFQHEQVGKLRQHEKVAELLARVLEHHLLTAAFCASLDQHQGRKTGRIDFASASQIDQEDPAFTKLFQLGNGGLSKGRPGFQAELARGGDRSRVGLHGGHERTKGHSGATPTKWLTVNHLSWRGVMRCVLFPPHSAISRWDLQTEPCTLA